MTANLARIENGASANQSGTFARIAGKNVAFAKFERMVGSVAAIANAIFGGATDLLCTRCGVRTNKPLEHRSTCNEHSQHSQHSHAIEAICNDNGTRYLNDLATYRIGNHYEW